LNLCERRAGEDAKQQLEQSLQHKALSSEHFINQPICIGPLQQKWKYLSQQQPKKTKHE